MYDLWSGTPTVPIAVLNNPGPAASDRFGSSVAVSGDTVAVGAPGESSGGFVCGAAYVFTRTSGVWTQQAYLKASNVGAGNRFGWSVAVSGDKVVVGAPFSYIEAAYVFTRAN